jgi:hypothetical protein
VGVGQNHDGISGAQAQPALTEDTVIDTDNFCGFKRSVTTADEFKLINYPGIS